MLLPRFLTALIGVPLILTAIWFGQIPFFCILFGVMMLSLYEYYTLAEESVWPVGKPLGLFCGAFLAITLFLVGTKMEWRLPDELRTSLAPAALSLTLLILIIGSLLKKNKDDAFLSMAVTAFGITYTVWTLSHLMFIRDLRPYGLRWTLFLFFVTWTLDIAAYGGGRKLGKRKLAEFISPNKTWEGAIIGSLCALVAAVISQKTFLQFMTVREALGMGLIIVLTAQLSDFSESLFKRNVRVKDSSALLPGHGGILDRFDSFFLAAPIFYYAVIFYF